MKTLPLKFQQVALHHAPLLHQLYLDTPSYFEVLGNKVPSLLEVSRDVETALFDPRRRLELVYAGSELLGYVDYKLDFPQAGDVTINLLLIRGPRQGQGWGERCVRELEQRLSGSKRLLAGVFGERPRVVRFWEKQGFAFATDARPVMTWYAKPLAAEPLASKPLGQQPVAS